MSATTVADVEAQVERLEDLLAGIVTLAGRAGAPMDITEVFADDAAPLPRRLRGLEGCVRAIVAMADVMLDEDTEGGR